METCWLRFDRYELNQSSAFPRTHADIPAQSLQRDVNYDQLCVSNAALRSTIRVTCCEFIFKRKPFMTLSKAVSVLWC